MNLLEDAWIPVRADGGSGSFRLLTYRELLCESGDWQVSLPRDDLEMACIQLLVCMTQVIFIPRNSAELRARIATPITQQEANTRIAPYIEWFDLDHPTQPFMQSRGVRAEKVTPIQKLMVGLPEGNNHAFFNEVGEISHLSDSITAIALFNQAANAQSMGGGFKGNLRGGTNPYLTPVTIFVLGNNLRETIWRNVLSAEVVKGIFPDHERSAADDLPNWIEPIQAGESLLSSGIGLARGLFWQPAKIELVRAEYPASCDVLEGAPVSGYCGFLKEQFKFTIIGNVWPHPHGVRVAKIKKDKVDWRYVSFSKTIPAWTLLSEFVVPRGIGSPDLGEGTVPAATVTQAEKILDPNDLHLLVGGYCANQATIVERRHELISLAKGWNDENNRIVELVSKGKQSRDFLVKALKTVSQGRPKKPKLHGIGVPIHETAEKMFYVRTEPLIHETFSNEKTFRQWQAEKKLYACSLAECCQAIYEELTDPYFMKPEFIPVIAWARRGLNDDLAKLKEGR